MVSVDDLLRFAAAGPERLARLAELAGRLAALEEERDQILAELASYGILAEATAAAPPPPPMPSGPKCSLCDEPADVTVDDVEYCDAHSREALQARLR